MVSKRREQQEVLRDFMSALAVCNNVTPVDRGLVAPDIEKNEEVAIREIARRSSIIGGSGDGLDRMRDSVDEDP